ncbi:M56 family metallopeptidase [Alteromonas lipotrueiana]|uniref:M56 family metallopeptidase n=1 Tax=Alteromonas lipotrueiana TaxID=2803815 RepID=UPI001C46F372|nr:M56 family metallopeptidase [Alteromonas lipotrueiana]
MFAGKLAISLNLLSIGILAFLISVLFLVFSTNFLLLRLRNLTFKWRKVALWLVVIAPWMVAACSMLFFLSTLSIVSSFDWLGSLAHWHHLDTFNLISWHGLTLLCTLGYLVWSATKMLFFHYRHTSAMAGLTDLSDPQTRESIGHYRYYLLNASSLFAFTTGLVHPKIYFSSALKKQVNEQELDIIVRHEAAHVRSRDPMFKMIFCGFAQFLPRAAARNLINHYILLTEEIADHSVLQHYDCLDVAQTLINVARVQHSISDDPKFGQASYFGNDQISMRIQRLICPSTPPSRLAIAGIATGLSLLILAIVPILAVSTVDSIHHSIEAVFTHQTR